MKYGIAVSTLLLAASLSSAQSIVRCEIVVPVLDSDRQPLTVAAPNGHSYPIFQMAPPSKLVGNVRRELETSFAQQALRLDHYARDLAIAKRTEAHLAVSEEWLTAPMYLLLSNEEGGFARFGFWLQVPSANAGS
jgi:hypothetical protein